MSLPTIRFQTPNIGVFEMVSDKDKSDVIIDKWDDIKDDILNDIQNVNIDILRSNNCMNKSLTSTNRLLQNENCYGCSIVKNFMEDFFVNNNKEIEIQTGKHRNSIIKIFSFNNTDTSLIHKIDKTTTSNPFNNYVMISCILDKILKSKRYPSYIPYLWSYICNNTFNILVNIKHMKTLKEISLNPSLAKSSPLAKTTIHNILNEKIMKDIFIQTILLCYFYSKHKFNHGEPSINYINFSPYKANFTFQGISVKSQITLNISPSTKSSIYYNGIRYGLNKTKESFFELPLESKDIGLDNLYYSGEYENHRIEYYKLGNQSEKFRISNINCYYFFPSFDCIMFLSSLVSENSFYSTFKDSKFITIWKNLWKSEEYESLMIRLTKSRSDFNSVFNVVKDYYMRKDALKYCMGCLVSLYN